MAFTKERLTALSNRENVGAILAEEIAELARIALASLEAEPVGEVVLGEYDDCGCHPDARVACIAADGQADWGNFKDGTRLYTAPPAPVSVKIPPEKPHTDGLLADGWNACRAAMLQGKAEPVSQRDELGWVACSERMPEGMVDVITSNGVDTGKGWWDGDNWKEWNKHDAVPGKITHWMPLPAAPQQERSNERS